MDHTFNMKSRVISCCTTGCNNDNMSPRQGATSSPARVHGGGGGIGACEAEGSWVTDLKGPSKTVDQSRQNGRHAKLFVILSFPNDHEPSRGTTLPRLLV